MVKRFCLESFVCICMNGNAFFEKLIVIGAKWKDVEIGGKKFWG